MWKTIEEFDGRYAINEQGTIINIKTKRTKSIWEDKDGYNVVTLTYKGKGHTRRIARLLAIAFIPNPFNLPEVNHIDEDKSNDSLTNLEWVSRLDNMRHGTLQKRKGEKLRKPVVATNTRTGKTIEFQSITDASKKIGINISNISAACRKVEHVKTAGGYKWNFKEV